MQQQLRFHPVDAGRLLQRFDDVRQQLRFHCVRVRQPASVGHEKIANHSFAALVDEKRIAADVAAFNGRVAGKNLRVGIAQDHIRQGTIVP